MDAAVAFIHPVTLPDALLHYAPELRVWRIDLTQPTPEIYLSADERARAQRLVLPDKRRRFIAARSGLRAVLSEATGLPAQAITFRYSEYGKPSLNIENEMGLQAGSVSFNLTHAADVALVAVADRLVGIDLEQVRPLSNAMHMVQMAFSPIEQSAWAALPEARRTLAFFHTWTRKEAVMKADGAGFKLAAQFNIPVTETLETILVDGWTVFDLPVEMGFVAAVAVR